MSGYAQHIMTFLDHVKNTWNVVTMAMAMHRSSEMYQTIFPTVFMRAEIDCL